MTWDSFDEEPWNDPRQLIGHLENKRRRGRVGHLVAAAFTAEGAVGLAGGSYDLGPVLVRLDRLARHLDQKPRFPGAAPVLVPGILPGGHDVLDVLRHLAGMSGEGRLLQLAVVSSGRSGPWYDVAGPVQPDSAAFVRHLRRTLEESGGFRDGQVLEVRWPIPPPPASLKDVFGY